MENQQTTAEIVLEAVESMLKRTKNSTRDYSHDEKFQVLMQEFNGIRLTALAAEYAKHMKQDTR